MALRKLHRFLLIAVPGIGDALLATPLIDAIRQQYPDATIDIMVRSGNEQILKDNSQIDDIISFPRRPEPQHYLHLLRRILRRYDVAISTSPSDRSFINCLFAAPRRLSVAPAIKLQTLWKYLLAEKIIPLDDTTHVIDQNLRLIDAINIRRSYRVVTPQVQKNTHAALLAALPQLSTKQPYIVIHAMPGSDYKVWPLNHWKIITKTLLSCNFDIVLSGGNREKEIALSEELAKLAPTRIHNACSKLPFDTLTALIQNAAAYIGTDTSTTHLAAAAGTLTFAIYGPSNILKWSPWPANYQQPQPPFTNDVGITKNGNVVVIRAQCNCTNFSQSCRLSATAESTCLAALKPDIVLTALQQHLFEENTQQSVGL